MAYEYGGLSLESLGSQGRAAKRSEGASCAGGEGNTCSLCMAGLVRKMVLRFTDFVMTDEVDLEWVERDVVDFNPLLRTSFGGVIVVTEVETTGV